jgi:hypothetical protein
MTQETWDIFLKTMKNNRNTVVIDLTKKEEVSSEEEQNEIDKNVKLNRELYLQNQKANPDDTI